MSGHGAWKRSEGDPKSVLGFAWADRNRVLQRPMESLGCFGLVGAVWLLFVQPLAAAALFGVVLLAPRLRRRPRAVDPLLTLPLVAPTYPCEVEIRRDGAPLGVDRGAVTFVDGWLVFEGFRTRFSLKGRDVRGRNEGNALFLEGGDEIVFTLDDVLEGLTGDELEQAFARDLNAWFRPEAVPLGESILPPVAVHPSGVARAWMDFAAASVGLAALVGLFVALASLAAIGVFVFGLGFVREWTEAWSNVRGVGRLAREERHALTAERVA